MNLPNFSRFYRVLCTCHHRGSLSGGHWLTKACTTCGGSELNDLNAENASTNPPGANDGVRHWFTERGKLHLSLFLLLLPLILQLMPAPVTIVEAPVFQNIQALPCQQLAVVFPPALRSCLSVNRQAALPKLRKKVSIPGSVGCCPEVSYLE